MRRDEDDTLCFARAFWQVVQRAPEPTSAQASAGLASVNGSPPGPTGSSPLVPDRLTCQPTPGLSRLNTARGLRSTLGALLTLPGWNGPLYTVAMYPWIELTGASPFALRYSSLLCGLLAVPLTYVLGRRLLGSPVGLAGAALVALSPHLVWYSQEAKMYAAILALALLAIYALRRAVDQTSTVSKDFVRLRWWGLMVLATTLALYTHILMAQLIPLLVVLGLIWWPRMRQHRAGALVGLALLTLPYLPLLAWQGRTWLLPPGQATLFNIGRLDAMLEATLDAWGGHFVGEPWATLILIGLSLLALFGLTLVWLTDQEQQGQGGDSEGLLAGWREPAALLTWMFLPLLGIWLISARQPIFTHRYLVWAAPALYLSAAAGVAALLRLGRAGALAGAGLCLVVLLGDGRALVYQATQPIKPDFQAAAAYLERRYAAGDLIVFHLSYMADNYDYYFDGPFDGWGAPAPAGGWSESDVDVSMRTNTSGRSTVWLVLSESDMWDPRGLIKAWLDAHAVAPPEEQPFTHVSVFRYQLVQ